MYDPAILTGANIFISIAVAAIAAVAAVMAVDIYKTTVKKPSEKK